MPEFLHYVQNLLFIFVNCCKETDLTVVTELNWH